MRESITKLSRDNEGAVTITNTVTRTVNIEQLMSELSSVAYEKERYVRDMKDIKTRYDELVKLEQEIKTIIANEGTDSEHIMSEIEGIVE